MNVIVAGGGTGGHLMPALAVADALVAAHEDIEPVLVGARRGVEAGILPNRPYRFHLLDAEPIYRAAWWRNAKWAVVLPRLLAQCRGVLDRERPRFVVGTGGYAAGPLIWLASRRGVPVALQEQNAFPGFTTRRLARYARQIHLGFPEAAAYLRPRPGTLVVTSGNPIVPPGRVDREQAKRTLGIEPGRAVVLVVGGSQGARAINAAVSGLVGQDAMADVAWLWSTGPGGFERYGALARPGSVQVRAFWDPMAQAYAAADVVVARAGAMTTAELCAWGLPAVLVPLPTAAADHQSVNAKALAADGAAIHLSESALDASALGRELRRLIDEPAQRRALAERARARGRPQAAADIAGRLLALL